MKKLGFILICLFTFFLATSSRHALAQLPAIRSQLETIVGQVVGNFSCPSEDYVTCLKEQFGVTVAGSPTQDTLKIIYDGLARGYNRLPRGASLLKSMTPTYTFSSSFTGDGGAWAITYPSGDQTFYQAFFTGSFRYRQYLVVHESAHAVANAKPSLQITLYDSVYNSGLDGACFNSYGVIKTYPLNLLFKRFPDGIPLWSKIHETWADSFSNMVFCDNTGTCPANGGGGESIPNFPGTCSNIYNYMQSNLGP